jgi:hypothetical protein
MENNTILKILQDTAYVRTGGSAEERRCANYIVERCAEMGLSARLEGFSVPMSTIHEA